MGGSFSEPATLIDIGEEIRRLYTYTYVAQRAGLHYEGLTTQEVVQGIQHVDDSLVLSKILCQNCLLKGRRKI